MELNFLTIADTAEELKPLRGLLAAFEREQQLQLSLRRVSWERAWQLLLIDALEGKGPHVSQIGSTWVPTMAMLEALRVFTANDVTAMGGEAGFLPSAWASVKLADEPEVWAIPWSIYTFVAYYRRDLFERAGVNAEEAFATPKALHAAFEELNKNGIAPWVFPSLHPYADLVHIASSWARANGGDFMGVKGREPLFGLPNAAEGLMDFFELFPYIPHKLRGLNIEACTQAFARGDAAVMIGGIELGDELMQSAYATQEMRENVAATTLPGVPWIGGDHLVIWKNVLADSAREQAALELLKFLSKRETQIQFYRAGMILPARGDAYDALSFPLASTMPALQKILATGCPHPPLRLWRRIEAFLDDMLLDIGSAVLKQPTTSPSDLAYQMLKDYEQKLAAVLSGQS